MNLINELKKINFWKCTEMKKKGTIEWERKTGN